MARRSRRIANNLTTYGDVHVGGKARAHLGDVVNHIHIERAFFDGDGTITSATLVRADVSKKRRHDITSDERSVKRLCNNQEVFPWSQELCIQDAPVGKFGAETISYPNKKRDVTLPVSEHMSSAVVPTRGSFLQILIRKIFNTAWSSHVEDTSATSRQIKAPGPILQYFSTDEHRTNGPSRTGSANAELLSLVVALIIFLVGRHTSAEDISRFLRRCRDDQLQPLLVLLLGIGLGRFWMSHIAPNLMYNTNEGITLETIFQQDIFVPFSICADFSILNAFLKHHYRGTPAETLVKAGKFNLMLGSRRGLVLQAHDWSTGNILKSKCRVVMSACLKTHNPKCSSCSDYLQISDSGDWICHLCDRFFRGFQNLRYLSQITATTSHSSELSSESEQSLLSEIVDDTCNHKVGSDNVQDFGSFKNIDIYIVPAVGDSVEFDHVISYVNKVKARFAQQPHIYRQFLDILQVYQRESKPIQDVHVEVTQLFLNEPDLLEDWKQFLPESAAHAKKQDENRAPRASGADVARG